MRGTSDNEPIEVADGDDAFDARQAAALLAQSTRDAQREFDPRPPVLMALMGVLVLVAYGVLWLSTRGQHPYGGPSGGAIVFTYAVVVVASVAMVKLHRRATIGVSGTSINSSGSRAPRSGCRFCVAP